MLLRKFSHTELKYRKKATKNYTVLKNNNNKIKLTTIRKQKKEEENELNFFNEKKNKTKKLYIFLRNDQIHRHIHMLNLI